MRAGRKGRVDGVGGDVFDVRVVAFAGGAARTREALQELFGLDREAAQRLVDHVPVVVRRAAPANEAQHYVEALRGIGAQVALERPEKPAAGERAVLAKPPRVPGPRKAPPPVPRGAEPLPRPILRQPTADLEFDLATGESGAGAEPATARDVAEPKSAGQAGGKPSRNEIEFNDGPGTGKLELAVETPRGPTGRSHARDKPAGESESEWSPPARAGAAVGGEQPGSLISRAAVVTMHGSVAGAVSVSGATARRQRTHALLRMLGAVSIAAGGVWLDSSIVHGNANVLSVLAHALAIYQFGVGARGMLP